MKKYISIVKKRGLMLKFKNAWEEKKIPFIFILLIICFWQLSVDLGFVKRFMLPSPSNVLVALFSNFKSLIPHIFVTLKETWIGFLLAILLSIILAILMDRFSIIKKACYPILIISQTIPLIVLAPLFLVWFGFGITPKIMIVVMICFFPIVISLYEGLESADRDMINLMLSMNATSFQIFRYVKFPSGLIGFFSGLRIAATYSVMGAVIGEWTGSGKGLGTYMLRSRNAFALDRTFAAVVLIIIMSWAMFKFVDYLQYVLMPWHRGK